MMIDNPGSRAGEELGKFYHVVFSLVKSSFAQQCHCVLQMSACKD